MVIDMKGLQMNHALKTWPCYFQAVMDGRKTFEIRWDKDRCFQAGDTVTLIEYELTTTAMKYSGRKLHMAIDYVCHFEQKDGWVVFSLRKIQDCR